jgi:integrase
MAHHFPIAVTAHLPLHSRNHTALPVIFLQDPQSGESEICMEIVRWASELSTELGTVSVGQHINTVCRFMNFFRLYSQGQSLSVKDQTISIFAYLDFRGTGTKYLESDHLMYPLNWNGVAKTTVSSEFKYLIRYFRFLESYSGDHAKILKRHFFLLPEREVSNLQKKSNDLFIHLATQRQFWADLRDDGPIRSPKRFRPTNKQNGFRPFPPEDEIKRIIAAESNPVFKAIWILLAYGASHRISEVLNIWQADILPSSYNKELFGLPADGLPLVLIAHPSQSKWLGDFNTKKTTRLEHLLKTYGIPPRSDRSSADPLYAGFKTKTLSGDFLIAKTWWLNEDAALAFEDCVDKISAFHLRHRTSRKHPYFFINMYAKDDRIGEPVTMKRITRAWVHACKRVGIAPHVRGRNIHGLRHFTKSYMGEIGLSRSIIQYIRGDHSIQSQDEYGRCAIEVNQALTQIAETKGA